MGNKRKQSVSSAAVRRLPKLAELYSMLILAVFPLILGFKTYYNITALKFWWFLGLFGSFAVAAAALALYERLAGSKGISGAQASGLQLKASLPRLIVILFFIWCSLSALASTQQGVFFGQSRHEGWLSLCAYTGSCLLVSFWGRLGGRCIKAVSFSAVIMGFIAVLQIYGSSIFFREPHNYWNTSFISTVGHHDIYAGVVSVFVPVLFCAYVFDTDKRRGLSFVKLAGIFLLLYSFLVSGVDSGKIGLAAAFIISAPFLVDSKLKLAGTLKASSAALLAMAAHFGIDNNAGACSFAGGAKFVIFLLLALLCALSGILLERRCGKAASASRVSSKTIRRIVAVIIIICIIASLIFLYFYDGSATLLSEISQILHGHLSDEAGSIRGYIWKASWEIIKGHSVLGSGPGSFMTEFAPYNEGYSKYSPNTYVDFAHNDFLQIGVCVGIVGLLIYVAFVASLFTRALFGKLSFKKPKADFGRGSGISASEAKAQRPSESGLANRVILISGIAGYLAHSFFSFSIAIVTPLFWVLAGLLIAETEKAE